MNPTRSPSSVPEFEPSRAEDTGAKCEDFSEADKFEGMKDTVQLATALRKEMNNPKPRTNP